MNLKRLQAFRAVFQLGSVTKASQQLHTTQPAVSRLIRDLEEELGLRRFARQHQLLSPAVEGRLFYRAAHILLTTCVADGGFRPGRHENYAVRGA